MKFFKSKALAMIVALLTVLMFLFTVVTAALFICDNNIYRTPYMILEGEYSVDDGDWKPFDPEKPITDRFHKITFRGNIPKSTFIFYQEVSVCTRNLWYIMRTEDGEVLLENKYQSIDEFLDTYFDGEEPDEDEKERMNRTLKKYFPFEFNMPNTPGYKVTELFVSNLPDMGIDSSTVLEMEFICPYDNIHSGFSDLTQFTVSHGNGDAVRFVRYVLPHCIIFMIVCLIGLLFFPMASFIFGKVDFRYLSFGFLGFFWGLYMILQITNNYIGYQLHDGTLCMFVDKICAHFFVISLLVYIRSNLTLDLSRIISGVITVGFTAATILTAVLHFTAVADMIVTGTYMNILMALNAAVMVLLLTAELCSAPKKELKNTILFIVSWLPMLIALIMDILDQMVSLPGRHYFRYGLIVALFGQIIRLIFDLRKQYLDAIRYQQMQKELYEAKVSVMVSQIRPHFMYNALTSIAMMCIKDPEVAQEATVTFAKYLRENMDSLKQKAPVPFEQELEHLKKYLYIEKLRFGKKLNIEYDIQTMDFVIPLLSVQPLVENAVKHGVGMKKNGGTVKISSVDTGDAYEVMISDDGVGFDTSAPKDDDGRSHIGMDNARTRLKEMCSGEVIIESTVGEGTTARIILPKEEQNRENTVS